MIIESFLVKIASAVFKKAFIGSLLKTVATAYEIYSIFDFLSDAQDCIEATTSCDAIGVSGLEIISDKLSEPVIDKIMSYGSDKFIVEKTTSGIYVASKMIPAFKANDIYFPTVSVKGQPTIKTMDNPIVRTK